MKNEHRKDERTSLYDGVCVELCGLYDLADVWRDFVTDPTAAGAQSVERVLLQTAVPNENSSAVALVDSILDSGFAILQRSPCSESWVLALRVVLRIISFFVRCLSEKSLGAELENLCYKLSAAASIDSARPHVECVYELLTTLIGGSNIPEKAFVAFCTGARALVLSYGRTSKRFSSIGVDFLIRLSFREPESAHLAKDTLEQLIVDWVSGCLDSRIVALMITRALAVPSNQAGREVVRHWCQLIVATDFSQFNPAIESGSKSQELWGAMSSAENCHQYVYAEFLNLYLRTLLDLSWHVKSETFSRYLFDMLRIANAPLLEAVGLYQRKPHETLCQGGHPESGESRLAGVFTTVCDSSTAETQLLGHYAQLVELLSQLGASAHLVEAYQPALYSLLDVVTTAFPDLIRSSWLGTASIELRSVCEPLLSLAWKAFNAGWGEWWFTSLSRSILLKHGRHWLERRLVHMLAEHRHRPRTAAAWSLAWKLLLTMSAAEKLEEERAMAKVMYSYLQDALGFRMVLQLLDKSGAPAQSQYATGLLHLIKSISSLHTHEYGSQVVSQLQDIVSLLLSRSQLALGTELVVLDAKLLPPRWIATAVAAVIDPRTSGEQRPYYKALAACALDCAPAGILELLRPQLTFEFLDNSLDTGSLESIDLVGWVAAKLYPWDSAFTRLRSVLSRVRSALAVANNNDETHLARLILVGANARFWRVDPEFAAEIVEALLETHRHLKASGRTGLSGLVIERAMVYVVFSHLELLSKRRVADFFRECRGVQHEALLLLHVQEATSVTTASVPLAPGRRFGMIPFRQRSRSMPSASDHARSGSANRGGARGLPSPPSPEASVAKGDVRAHRWDAGAARQREMHEAVERLLCPRIPELVEQAVVGAAAPAALELLAQAVGEGLPLSYSCFPAVVASCFAADAASREAGFRALAQICARWPTTTLSGYVAGFRRIRAPAEAPPAELARFWTLLCRGRTYNEVRGFVKQLGALFEPSGLSEQLLYFLVRGVGRLRLGHVQADLLAEEIERQQAGEQREEVEEALAGLCERLRVVRAEPQRRAALAGDFEREGD